MDATAGATVALALVTALLAGATFFMALKTREAVNEAKRQTKVGADTLRQMRQEQELGQRPRLVVLRRWVDPDRKTGKSGQGDPPDAPVDLSWDQVRPFKGRLIVHVANVGRGPAIDIVVAYQDEKVTIRSFLPHSIGPGSSADIDLGREGPPPALFDVQDETGSRMNTPTIPTYALLCYDETARRVYRFQQRSPGFEVWEAGKEAPPWREAALGLGMEPKEQSHQPSP